MKYGLGLFVLTLLCCSQDDTKSLTSSNLKGKWIETVTRMDTLSFESLDNLDVMNLNRGKELKNGNLLPKPKSGPYRYELLEQKISLNGVLSSDSSFKDYYLRFDLQIINYILKIFMVPH
ncbi:hypothetical protein [Arenibacter sp. ARW7G5Y1]|uniref:hypothetical protein n=1 Tax=Arenibacter sp. ARW7G5Y1 TaxID=2135619 RepID=UPI000D76B4EB|nr:hypothetical protein [Arenibacter sp. ARW7G5Y1]PXX22199.1 hypothetical protein C7972_12618 [Arenibacter sp. ARW7G5Y1]